GAGVRGEDLVEVVLRLGVLRLLEEVDALPEVLAGARLRERRPGSEESHAAEEESRRQRALCKARGPTRSPSHASETSRSRRTAAGWSRAASRPAAGRVAEATPTYSKNVGRII